MWGGSANKDIYKPSWVHLFTQVHRCCGPQIPPQNFITCLSADNEVVPFLRTENNFRQCRQRNVATRQTLPRIQTSLSLKKLSIVKKKTRKKRNKVPSSSPSVCTSCFLLQLLCCWAASCWHLARRWASNPEHRTPGAFKVQKRLLAFKLQSDSEVWRLCRRATCPLSQPSTPPPSFLPCPPPPLLQATLDQKGEDMPSVRWEFDRWCWFSGCPYCTQIRAPAATGGGSAAATVAAGMLARPPRCPLTL